MNCPFCQGLQTGVIDSRDNEETVRRRRECFSCKKRWTTIERVEGLDLKVIKKDGSKENFDREKIRRGVAKATWRRPVSMAAIEGLIESVEQDLRVKGAKEIKSWEIGNLIIERLRSLDKLSYLLFASVYRDFTTIEDFEQEIAKLKSDELSDKK
ncbi:transcriptional regulator NrdR [Microgenomates group bacterium]|nr:transcriptional regulator NrdR [Microgenomates group bacterium]